MAETFIVTIEKRTRSISQLADSDLPAIETFGVDRELSGLLEILENEAKIDGIEIKDERQQIDRARGKNFQFPTTDIELVKTITYICVTTAASANFVKTLLEIIDKALDIRKKLKDDNKYGSEYKYITLKISIRDETLGLEDAGRMKSKLGKIEEDQIATRKKP